MQSDTESEKTVSVNTDEAKIHIIILIQTNMLTTCLITIQSLLIAHHSMCFLHKISENVGSTKF